MFLEEEVAAIANSYKVFRGDAGKEVRALGARGERLERTSIGTTCTLPALGGRTAEELYSECVLGS